jgi:hypothetical protein
MLLPHMTDCFTVAWVLSFVFSIYPVHMITLLFIYLYWSVLRIELKALYM